MVVPASRAVAAPTPTTGPTAGGTSVSDTVAGKAFSHVVMGAGFSAALDADGNAYAWGSNAAGNFGNGTKTDSPTPTATTMPAGVTFKQLAAGASHVVALGSDGFVYTWGYNGDGELGNGTTQSNSLPAKALTPAGVTFTEVAAGEYHTVAIASDGSVYTWGSNTFGELGIGSTASSSTPVKAKTPAGVTFTHAAAGTNSTLVLASDGSAYAWGSNQSGELGDGTGVNNSSPVKVTMPAGLIFTQITAGETFKLAIASNGALYSWGDNLMGELGTGTSDAQANAPVAVAMPSGVKVLSIGAGASHGVAVGSDGATYAWGNNNVGALGTGDYDSSTTPVKAQMPAGVTFTQVEAGGNSSVAIGSNGTTYAWGDNIEGQLGDGTKVGRDAPTPVAATVTVNEVLFGDVAGTNLTSNGGSWTATTPAACGVKDVTVKYTQYGVQHTAVTPNGFTFGSAPVITAQPQGTAVDSGASATFTATATGDNAPTVQWQQASSADGTWTDIDGAMQNQATLTPTANTFVRAVFSNCVDTATTDVAQVTINAVTPTPTPGTSTSPSVTPSGQAPSSVDSVAPAGNQVSTSGAAGTKGPGIAAVVIVLLVALAAALVTGRLVSRRTRH